MARKPSIKSRLEPYQAKRQFDQTTEPAGQADKALQPSDAGLLSFVVQKHAAGRLHYDFRLELDGILKSWAVPKGPSLNPEDKRLAVMVEDHPYDYRDFEGIIAKGNYGAGTVMVWDEGTCQAASGGSRAEQEQALRAGLGKGHLSFILGGTKLRGGFDLIKVQSGQDDKAWLLVKKSDEYATYKDVLYKDMSAASGRSMGQIAEQTEMPATNTPQTSRQDSSLLKVLMSGAPKASFPGFIKPMLASVASGPFDDADWWFEIKWDGYRIEALINDGRVELLSRNERSYTRIFQPISRGFAGWGHSAILDGEVVALDELGRPDFSLLQAYGKTGKGDLVYYVFDILHVDGYDLTGLALERRQGILQAVLPDQANIRFSDHIEGQGEDFFAAAARQKLEGVMAKDKHSPYLSGKRSGRWQKIKSRLRQEAVVGGYTEARDGRGYMGALILGVYDQSNKLIYIGHAGSGFDQTGLADIYRQLKKLEVKRCPFSAVPQTNAPAHWVRPQLVCEIEFGEWTKDGRMRQPIFVGMHQDRSPQQVARQLQTPIFGETRQLTQPSIKPRRRVRSDPEMTIAGQTLTLSNVDKIYFPDDGYSKGDVIEYYRQVEAIMMPYLKGRLMSLHRHPNGIAGKSFYQKDMEAPPDWLRTWPIHSESEDKTINYLVAENAAALIYMASLGCIEINPWSSRIDELDRPSWCIIDLDPEAVEFDTVILVAQAVHELLEAAGVPNYAKTSGASGMHIYIPLGDAYSYDQSKDFAQIIARLVQAQLPTIASVERRPAKRQQQVYLDYLQNRRGQTVAAAYSVRPRRGATVSAPLDWAEVKAGLSPDQFTIKTMPKRLDQLGDIWKGVNAGGFDMSHALNNLAGL